MSETAGGAVRLEDRGDILERLAVAIAQQAIAADTGEEDIDVAIRIEVGRGDAEATEIAGQSEGGRGILETAFPLVQKQGVVNALGPDHRRGQEQVEPSVTIGVEGRDGRAEAGANAADDRSRAGEVGRFDPPLTLRRV